MSQSGEVSSAPPPTLPVPLPLGEQRESSQTSSGERLGLVPVFLVATLAFLLASFPARNSDWWPHLTRGRFLAHGQIAKAMASDLTAELRDNQTWIYDLLCYGCYKFLGDSGVVFCKALLAAGIALLLLSQSRSTPGWGLAVVCTSLALLAMSLYLQLQAATVSYFLLALTLSLLRPRREMTGEGSLAPWFSWPLVLLFVVWANVDRWFVLGLGVVGLVWLGEIVEQALGTGGSFGRRQSTLLRRAFSFALLAAACLLNPSHRHAFALTAELSRFWSPPGQTMSPFESVYFAKVGWTPAGLAYYLLLGLSLLSFVAALPRWNWRRFLPWLGLALLSGFQARAIPFFAVVAGPVLAGNVREWLARRFDWERVEPERETRRRLGRALTVVLMLVLLVCAWPGWLQTPPFGPRRWSIDLPPSLERGAAAVRRWRQEGKLAADTGGLHLSSETVHAFTWFCPDEKRLRLTWEASALEWRRRMRADSIQYLVLYDTNRPRLFAALGGLLADPEQWPLLYQEGDLAIFGWRDPARPGSAKLFRGLQQDLNRLAFYPDENKKAPSEASDREAAVPRWWDAFWKSSQSSSLDREEAMLHLFHAEAIQRAAPMRHLSRWENSQAAGLVAAAAAWTTPTNLYDAHLRLTLFRPHLPEAGAKPARLAPLDRMTVVLQKRYTLQRDDAPAALYYLAVRAARRAVKTNPEDAQAYLWLGESYLGLLHATRERAWVTEMPKLAQLRQAQASAALQRAVALQPDFARAHLSLGRLYQEMGYLDLALKHLQIHRRFSEQAGPPQGVSREEHRMLQTQLEEDLNRLSQEVEKRGDSSAIGSAGGTLRDRAVLSYRKGMASQALDLLLESHLAAFGPEGMTLELELLLGVGRSSDVRAWLRPEHEVDLGGFSYHWVLTRALAASGEYTRAEEECAEATEAPARIPGKPESLRFREVIALLIGKLVLDEQPGGGAPCSDLRTPFSRVEFAIQIGNLSNLLRQRAELTVLRGLLALEEGEMDEAEIAFRSALALWKDQAAATSGEGLDFNGRILAQTYLRRLTEARP